MIAIPEVRRNGTRVFHLMRGRWEPEAVYQPVWCGGGVTLPWRETVTAAEVCRTCKVRKRNSAMFEDAS